MAKATEGMLSAGKISKEVGASAAKVKKAIEKLNLEPAKVHCGCKYYDQTQIAQIKKEVG